MRREHESVTYTPCYNDCAQKLECFMGPADGKAESADRWATSVDVTTFNEWTGQWETHCYGVALRFDAYTGETFTCLVWVWEGW